MRHIQSEIIMTGEVTGIFHVAACGELLQEGDSLVIAALQSDCIPCRNVFMVGGLTQKGCELRPLLDYTPEPMKDIETLEEIQRRRDGR